MTSTIFAMPDAAQRRHQQQGMMHSRQQRCRCRNCGYEFLADSSDSHFCSGDCRITAVIRGANYPGLRPGVCRYEPNPLCGGGGSQEGPLQREARIVHRLSAPSSSPSSVRSDESSGSKPVPVPSPRARCQPTAL
ncbi:hypothetical protein JKP88DRAFT_81983 [Tribonema minus]|uniref:Uncharacterized protein n=1 Tax=Tribonema minus TaxID=303371 RepID=A0A835YW43_9STRA|nr:hypothetical protein JKP88DRAFT_81983 [Tribonema minus]